MKQEHFDAIEGRERYEDRGVFVEDESYTAGTIYRKDDLIPFFRRHPSHHPAEYNGSDKPIPYTMLFDAHLGIGKGNRVVVVPESFEETDPGPLQEYFHAYRVWYDPTRVNPQDFEAPQTKRTRTRELEKRLG